jgi:tetratricopeptide (TPR) repeat protein
VQDAAELRTERALCKVGLGDDAGALEDLQGALAKEPRYAPAQFYLGGRFAAAGRWKEAASCYDAYLKLAPKGPMAKVAAERAAKAKALSKK